MIASQTSVLIARARILIGGFRLDNEYEIEYEYDFRCSNQ